MLKKGIINYVLDNYKYIDILKELSEDEIGFLRDRINKIEMYKLFKYEFHGIFHSQKVMLFAYLIGKHKKLNEEDMKILLDAAIYHDMGRSADFEEVTHGYASALRVEKLFQNDDFYKNSLNLDLLKAITEGHSLHDSKKRKTFINNSLDDEYYDRYSVLYDALKDADALDRARFPKTAKENIREEFLRFEFSKELINFAFTLNKIYRTKIDEANFEKYEKEFLSDSDNKGCLHGIGFDFCKLEGILDNGILSGYAAMQKGISVSRNFEGNNSDMWISVIDSADVSNQGKAYKKFADANISFYCFTGKYSKGDDNPSRAQSLGLPFNSREYEDESFVFDEIPKENIYGIILPSKSNQLNLSELNYLYCSSNFKTVGNRVDSYCNYIETLTGIVVDRSLIDILITELYKQEIQFGLKSEEYQQSEYNNFARTLDVIVGKINHEICKWMSVAFKQYFNLDDKEEPTVYMVVMDILKRKNIDYTLMGDESTETVIQVDLKMKEFDTENKTK